MIYFMKIKKLKIINYKIFYEIISEDKIQNRFPNGNINNNNKNFNSTDKLEKSNTTINNDNEKIIDTVILVLPNNETNQTKLEIEIKVIKKSCCVRYKRKISNCCDKCKDFFKKCCPVVFGSILGFIVGILIIAFFFLLYGGWVIFLIIFKK